MTAEMIGGLLTIAVVIGVFYNLWNATRSFGGIIGQGIRRIGIGIVFLTLEAIDRIAQNFGASGAIATLFPLEYRSVMHDSLLLVALFFLSLGFAKFSKALKS